MPGPHNVKRARTPAAPIAAALLAAALLAGCGSDDGDGDGGDGSAARAALPATEFPSAEGRTLEQVLASASEQGPVVTPAFRVLREGENRFSFGVFTVEKEPITTAQVALYAAPGNDLSGPARGPFPAKVEDLGTEAAFVAKTTSGDPDAAKTVYVSEIPLDKPGAWTFAALIKEGDGYSGSLIGTPSLVGEFTPVGAGDKAPSVSTPVASDVADISEIDTRVPPGTMHDEDLQEVLGKKPVVLLFATPALCQTRICGPVVDVAEQVKRDSGGEAAFIHQEIYVDNDISKGPRPQSEAYNLPSEPWLFVIDRDGVVRTAIEGAFSVAELEDAVRQVTTKSQ